MKRRKKELKVNLENWLSFLNDMQKNEGKKIGTTNMCRKHKISTNAGRAILKSGLFTMAGEHMYKSMYDKFEPIHARKLAEATRKYQRSFEKKRQRAAQKTIKPKYRRSVKKDVKPQTTPKPINGSGVGKLPPVHLNGHVTRQKKVEFLWDLGCLIMEELKAK